MPPSFGFIQNIWNRYCILTFSDPSASMIGYFQRKDNFSIQSNRSGLSFKRAFGTLSERCMSNIEQFDIASQVIDSMVEVFDTMVSMSIEHSESESQDTGDSGRIVAAVNFAGNVAGTLNIQATPDFARLMTATMLEIEPEELEDDGETRDLLSEISNIVGGNLKSALNDAGFTCVLSTPSMTYGGDFTIKSLNTDRFERFVFSYQHNWIIVEVSIKEQPGAGDDVRLASPDNQGQPPNVDVDKINALDINAQVAESTIDVFDTMFSVTLEPVDSVTSDSLEGIRNVGSVSFAGDVTGMVSIHVSEAFALEMASEMLGMGVDEIEGDEEIRDMLGEVGNIVGGNLKSSFTDAGLACVLSTPSFTTGTDFKIETLNMEKYERFAFKCNHNIIFAEVGVKFCELSQLAAQGGKEIHYSVNDESPTEDEGAADEENSQDMQTGESESTSELTSQSDIDAFFAEAKAAASPEPQAPPSAAEPAAHPHTASEPKSYEDVDLDLLLDIPLEIKVELGRAKIQIQDLLNLAPGSAVKLIKLEGEPVDILANDTLIARGEVVIQNEKYGIRVTEIISRLDRIRSIGI